MVAIRPGVGGGEALRFVGSGGALLLRRVQVTHSEEGSDGARRRSITWASFLRRHARLVVLWPRAVVDGVPCSFIVQLNS